MNKTPQEIRLEVVTLAKDMAWDAFYTQKEALIAEYHNRINKLSDKDKPPEYPVLPKHPTETDIVEKAKILYAFIDHG